MSKSSRRPNREAIKAQRKDKAQIKLVRSLIRKKKFVRYLIQGRYPIAIDGTQKIVRNYLWHQINVVSIGEATPDEFYPKLINRTRESPPQYSDFEEGGVDQFPESPS